MLVLLLSTTSAPACSYDLPPTLALDTASADEAAPAPPEIVAVEVQRGRGDDGKACEDLGSMVITVARPAGDPDSDDEVGYRLELLDGQLPMGLGPAPLLGPEIVLLWSEGGPPHDPFDATLALVPVDVAGNEGAPVEVSVGDPGGCGCRSGAAPTGAWAVGALLIAARCRRGRA